MLDLVELPSFSRTRWLALASVLALAAAAAGVNTICQRSVAAVPTVEREPEIICIELVAEPPLAPIELERRWVIGGSSFSSVAELDEALGEAIVAWQPFYYKGDAQPRLAIASEPYTSAELRSYEFARDEHGNVWLVRQQARAIRPSGTPVTYTRDIFLIPAGASFRGVR